MTTQFTLSTKAFGKKAKQEILKHSPTATKFSSMNVPAMGKVYYIYDKDGNSLGHSFMEYKNGRKFRVYLMKNK